MSKSASHAAGSQRKVEAVRHNQGRLPHYEYLRLRGRYSTVGAILGVKGFVKDVFRHQRTRLG